MDCVTRRSYQGLILTGVGLSPVPCLVQAAILVGRKGICLVLVAEIDLVIGGTLAPWIEL